MQEQDLASPIRRGEDVILNFTMTPLTDITGWTISCRIKRALADPITLVTITASITSAAAGTFAVALGATQTSTLSAGTYVYDVWRTNPGAAAGLAIGSVLVKGTVKQP